MEHVQTCLLFQDSPEWGLDGLVSSVCAGSELEIENLSVSILYLCRDKCVFVRFFLFVFKPYIFCLLFGSFVFFFILFGERVSIYRPWLSLDLLYRPGWSWTYKDHLLSAGIKGVFHHAQIVSSTLHLYIYFFPFSLLTAESSLPKWHHIPPLPSAQHLTVHVEYLQKESVSRYDQNCHFWRFCRQQVLKVKYSLWKR